MRTAFATGRYSLFMNIYARSPPAIAATTAATRSSSAANITASMAPKLMPGNPTDATITLRLKGSDLAALKTGRLTPEEAARRIDVKKLY